MAEWGGNLFEIDGVVLVMPVFALVCVEAGEDGNGLQFYVRWLCDAR